jgi:hypothetical protein
MGGGEEMSNTDTDLDQRRAALRAAAIAIARAVPDAGGLGRQLEFAGGSARLVKALRAAPAELRSTPRVDGVARPDPETWVKGARR